MSNRFTSISGQPYSWTKKRFIEVMNEQLPKLGITYGVHVQYAYGYVLLTDPETNQQDSHTIIVGATKIVCEYEKDQFILELLGEDKVLELLNTEYGDVLSGEPIQLI